MKKLLSLFIVSIMLLSCFSLFATADIGLPFDTAAAPTNVAVVWLEGNDSPTTMSFSYSLPNEMASFYNNFEEANVNGTGEEFLSRFDFYNIWSYVQIDWAIDDVNDEVSGWHFNEYWTARGDIPVRYDEDWNIRTSEWDCAEIGLGNATDTVQTVWVMRSTPDDDRWNGNPDTKTPGVKDQLRPEQYEYYDDTVHIDFTKHTAYFRARFVTVTCTSTDDGDKDTYYYSGWSDTVGYGKDIAAIEPLKQGDIDAPVISGLRMMEVSYNNNPVVAFTLTVPEKLQTQVTNVSAAGGTVWVYAEVRVQGDAEWTEMQTGDWTVKPGELRGYLECLATQDRPLVPKDTVVEIRCRYYCSQTGADAFYSDYSKIISFGTDDISADTQQYTTGTGESGENDTDKKVCPICRFCPQPLGLCIFIWLIILVVIIIAVTVIIVIVSKNKKKKEEK